MRGVVSFWTRRRRVRFYDRFHLALDARPWLLVPVVIGGMAFGGLVAMAVFMLLLYGF